MSFERLGLSADKEVAFKEVQQKIEPATTMDLVKSHYFFDFLNLPSSALISEGQLYQPLLNHLQEFIIELDDGFCFEARQKKILIGDEYFFIDLVFYHRILKCHVLIVYYVVYNITNLMLRKQLCVVHLLLMLR